MTTDAEKVQALIEEGDRDYRAGKYGYAGVSYNDPKKLAPTDPEVLARCGLAVWKQVPGYFAELMAAEGIREPADGCMSMLSDAASEAAQARSDELEKAKGWSEPL
jgi:hypothetical protein